MKTSLTVFPAQLLYLAEFFSPSLAVLPSTILAFKLYLVAILSTLVSPLVN